MSTGNPFWTVVGRACCDRSFRSDCAARLGGRVTPTLAPLHEEVEGLKKHVLGTLGYRLDNKGLYYFYDLIYRSKEGEQGLERGVLADFGRLAAAANFGRELADPIAWQLTWEVIGLACTDRIFRAQLHEASGNPEAFRAELEDGVPGFALGGQAREVLRDLFAQVETMQVLRSIHILAWRIPYAEPAERAACETAIRHDEYVFIRQDVAMDLFLLQTAVKQGPHRRRLRARVHEELAFAA